MCFSNYSPSNVGGNSCAGIGFDQLASSAMPDDSQDDAESSPIAGWNRRNVAIGIGCGLVATLLVGFVVWSYAFRPEPPTREAISRAQNRGDFEVAVALCIQLAEADQDQAAEALAPVDNWSSVVSE